MEYTINQLGSFTCHTNDSAGNATTADVSVGTAGAKLRFGDTNAPSSRYTQPLEGSDDKPQFTTVVMENMPFDPAKQASPRAAAIDAMEACRKAAPWNLAPHMDRLIAGMKTGQQLGPQPKIGVGTRAAGYLSDWKRDTAGGLRMMLDKITGSGPTPPPTGKIE